MTRFYRCRRTAKHLGELSRLRCRLGRCIDDAEKRSGGEGLAGAMALKLIPVLLKVIELEQQMLTRDDARQAKRAALLDSESVRMELTDTDWKLIADAVDQRRQGHPITDDEEDDQ